jgi:hypothetical protein
MLLELLSQPLTFVHRVTFLPRPGTSQQNPGSNGIRNPRGALPLSAYVIVTVLAAALVAFSAGSLLLRAKWVVQGLEDYGVPRSWWPWLGAAKAAGAAGLLVGLLLTPIGVMAGIGLVLYFTGAVITVIRAHWYSHIPFPLVYLTPVVASLALAS